MDYLNRSCNVGSPLIPKDTLDLATDSGEVLDLPGRAREYARRYLEPRGTYYLVKVVGGGNNIFMADTFHPVFRG